MIIDERSRLTVLLTALHVAKWESTDDNSHVRELAASPVFADLYNEVVDEMIKLEHPPARERWTRWREIERRPTELALVKSRIRSSAVWASWSNDQKRKVIHQLLSPFTATAATIEDLLSL